MRTLTDNLKTAKEIVTHPVTWAVGFPLALGACQTVTNNIPGNLLGQTPKDIMALATAPTGKGNPPVVIAGSANDAIGLKKAFEAAKTEQGGAVNVQVVYLSRGIGGQFGAALVNKEQSTVRAPDFNQLLQKVASDIAARDMGGKETVYGAAFTFGEMQNYGKATCDVNTVETMRPGTNKTDAQRTAQCRFESGTFRAMMQLGR